MISDEAWGPDGDLPLAEEPQGQFLDAWFCGKHVSDDSPDTCVVCLAAEVEALRANLVEIAADHNDQVAVAHDLRAQVQRVRQACDAAFPINDIPTLVVTRSAVLHALEGDSDD